MRRQIVSSVRAGEGVIRTAERLLDIDAPIVRLPEHVRAVRDAARGGGPALREEVALWRSRVNRLGQGGARRAGNFTIRSATQDLMKKIQSAAHPADVDRAVNRWALERARYQARVVARTETANAYGRAYQESTSQHTWVKGYRWNLSASHAIDDVCDVLANQDTAGLGPGGYPSDGIPTNPHPMDLCYTVAITDPDHFAREAARIRGEEEPPRGWESDTRQTGGEWLRSLPRARQVSILGPTRARLLGSSPGRVVNPDGTIRPVWQALGRSGPPPRSLGPPLPARPLIAADRASMVQPFPAAP